jgi:hypothetical protein
MSPSPSLSRRQQIVSSLACTLLFSIAVAASGWMAGSQTRAEIAALAAERAIAAGVVIDKRVDRITASKTPVWWLAVAFPAADGRERRDSLAVADAIYDRYRVGDPVLVAYVKSHPEWFFVPGTEPRPHDIAVADGCFRWGATGAIVSLFGLLGLRRAGRRGDAAPRAQLALVAPPVRSARGFGARRSF